MPECSIPDCGKPVKSKGMCKLHYDRTWRTGAPHVTRPCLHLPTEVKFWLYVKVAGENECWTWTGLLDPDGYGQLRTGKLMPRAHRVSWTLHFGPIPPKLLVLHDCNNPACVNPAHLKLGDHDANMRDRVRAGHYLTNEGAPAHKFPDAIVTAVRAATGTYEEIGKRFGVSISQVGNIRRGDQRPQETA